MNRTLPIGPALLGMLAAVIVVIVAPRTLIAQPITYQGRLDEAGTPATGHYDLELRLFDAVAGGNQLAPTVTLPAVAVENGLFTIHPDFGEFAFTTGPQAPRYLQVAARPAGVGAYQTLTPRQPLTPAPLAIKAVHESWRPPLALPVDPSILRTQPGVERAFINRDQPIGPADYFGVDLPAGAGSGGVFLNTLDTTSASVYAHSVMGQPRAATFYSGFGTSAEAWGVVLGESVPLVVLASGNVGINQPSPAAMLDVNGPARANALTLSGPATAPTFSYPAPQARSLVISPMEFRRVGNGQTTSGPDGAWNGTQSDDNLVAPFTLPQGAVITGATFHYLDNSTSNFSLSVNRRTLGGGTIVAVIATNSSGQSTTPAQHTVTLSTPHAVDPDSFYYIRAFILTWAGDPKILGVRIHYTMPGPE
ncbi:MAG TPA: hypothetical protein VD997_13215 [Phycisphaerales bacterium]|nr:hypothetical protein [Phycisphaerales bacterium]